MGVNFELDTVKKVSFDVNCVLSNNVDVT